MKFESDKYFPAGRMRVLAVDDNSTCLIVLEALLRKCQYNVTSIKDATTALQILRENKKEFDLVISEVHLPDMDAFKLLEEVTLQMDIPVVLMSSDDDKERVTKGIIYGACDYLLKPVRIEELKNIWQHVVRRKINNKCAESSGTGSSVVSKKRKEQTIVEEELDHHDYEELKDYVTLPPKQKKPRVVWLPELHHKFVAAVDQMGVDKAMPKRILELMNVEGITRENVASHLQKYRMFLKRSANPQQANKSMLSSFGSPAHYGQVDKRQIISRQFVSYPPLSRHRCDHSDNNNSINDPTNNNVHYSSSSMMMHYTMNKQSHEPTMPIAEFVDDFSISCDFTNNNLMLDDQAESLARDFSSKLTNLDRYNHNHNNSWPISVCHGQQGWTNFYLPTSTTTSPASQFHNMNYDSAPSRSVLRREFPKSSCCLQVESSYDDGGSGGGGGVSMQQDDDGSREQASGERQYCTTT